MEIKLKEGVNAYHVVADIFTQLVHNLYGDYSPGELIVNIGFKDRKEDAYEYINTVLYPSSVDIGCYRDFLDDWHEGQNYIDVNAFIPLEEVRHFAFNLDGAATQMTDQFGSLTTVQTVSKQEWINPTYTVDIDTEGFDVI